MIRAASSTRNEIPPNGAMCDSERQWADFISARVCNANDQNRDSIWANRVGGIDKSISLIRLLLLTAYPDGNITLLLTAFGETMCLCSLFQCVSSINDGLEFSFLNELFEEN